MSRFQAWNHGNERILLGRLVPTFMVFNRVLRRFALLRRGVDD